MARIAAFVTEHGRLAWGAAVAFVLATAVLAGWLVREARHGDRLEALSIEAERRGIDIMSQTLNGNVMGSIALLGLVEDEIKRDALGAAAANSPRMLALLESVARAHGAEGVFVVGRDGMVHSSWDSSGRPSTGLDVKFRPYWRMAMQGRENVYAAVSLARGDRALYFAAPVFRGAAKEGAAIGAVVARTNLDRVDALLRGKADMALLLSPQGVVFASSRPDWVGMLAGTPTPSRLAAIRDLKQFGAMFENREPTPLPVTVEEGFGAWQGQRLAVAGAAVDWNDQSGPWRLVLMEDLGRTVPVREPAWGAVAAGCTMTLIGLLALNLLRGHHAQTVATRRIAAFAHEQEASAKRKSDLADASLRFQRAGSAADLAQAFLAECHRLLGALQGVVYAFEAEGAADMRLLAGFACSPGLPETLAPGEGLLGQVVADRRAQVLDVAGDGRWLVRSGLGDARPAAVIVAPLLLEQATLGVAAVAVLAPLGAEAAQQFEEMSALLALNLEIQRRHARAPEAVP
ncbi:MAG: GAF domain-containing protein [Actinomycetota bacterium]